MDVKARVVRGFGRARDGTKGRGMFGMGVCDLDSRRQEEPRRRRRGCGEAMDKM
jgi:hypothetical protein